MAAHLSSEHELHFITFKYGQRSKTELRKAETLASFLGVTDRKVVDISFMKDLYGSSNVLTDIQSNIPERFEYGIVVPVRNAIFISIAAAWAFSIGAEVVAYGAHRDDINYPDCRPEFVDSITKMVNLAEIDGIEKAMRKKVEVWCPAMDGMGKSDLLKIGYKILGDKLFETWSCYTDGVKLTNEDAVHCGVCESCMNRKKAFIEAGIEDKTKYGD